MKRPLIVLLFLGIYSLASAQRTLVAPKQPTRIFPVHRGGDRDFWGHGPRVSGDIRVVISEGKSQLIAFINLRLEETEGDGSLATIDETRLLYSAPEGKQIKLITYPATLTSHVDSKLPKGGINRVNGANNTPLSHLIVNGDTGGSDIGNNTEDDSHVTVFFRGMVIELEPLPAGVREVTIPKTLFASTLSTQLRGTTGKINTYGPRVGDSWFKANDSWLKFPEAIRRDPIVFDQLTEIRILPRRYYYNDINLRNITARSFDQYLRISVNWEGDGPEIRGECVDDAGCMFGTPTVQLDDFRIQIDVRPSVQAGKLTYDQFDIQVAFAYNFGADCGILSDLCKEIFKDPLQNAFFRLRSTLGQVLQNETTKNEISGALNTGVLEFIRGFGRFPEVTTIVDVADAGNQLRIRCR